MKLIVTDLDNTLLRSDKTISEYTVNVLRRCVEKGYRIVIATARAENAMKRFIDQITPYALISSGGSMVTLKGEVIYSSILSPSDVSVILNECTRITCGKGKISVESVAGYFCNFVPDDIDRFNAFEYKDFSSFNYPCYKITAELEHYEWGEIIAEKCSDCSVLRYSGEKWHRFSTKTSTKEIALIKLLDILDINCDDVIAFGDDFNDLGMLKLAGISVAPSNAIDKIKSVSQYITCSNNDDGVARFLEKYIL
ncbi:MAG: HAD-IIB family hydrolase [Clostridia bacterium]|nr:HAD-IIB family hydrolase [Clostridia bacterium]